MELKSKGSLDSSRNSQRQEVVCYNYGQKGHQRPRCAEPPLCYKCKGRGHISKECTVGVGTPNVSVDISSVRVNEVDGSGSALSDKLMSPSPRGRINIRGEEIGCVFDTGAETSIIPSSIFHTRFTNKGTEYDVQELDGLFISVVGVGGV